MIAACGLVMAISVHAMKADCEVDLLGMETNQLASKAQSATFGLPACPWQLHVFAFQGLFPVWISRTSGRFTVNQILTVGAMGDSFYEYLLKVWLLLRKQVRDH